MRKELDADKPLYLVAAPEALGVALDELFRHRAEGVSLPLDGRGPRFGLGRLRIHAALGVGNDLPGLLPGVPE